MSRLTRDGTGRPNPSRETRFSGANGDRERFIFSVQLTMALCMYVCMVITYSRVWINRVRLPILLVVS